MAILLHNLVACVPTLDDITIVSELIHVCDINEYGMSNSTREDILSDWQRPSFSLKTDAWVIYTVSGQLTSYASVWDQEPGSGDMRMCIYVHPDYRQRGIGTLLLRLAEARARQYASKAHLSLRVALSKTVGKLNAGAQTLLEQEGYTCVREFWRIAIEVDDLSSSASGEINPRGKLKVAFDVDTPNATGVTRLCDPSGTYVVQHYCTYEKELRTSEALQAIEDPCMQLV